VPTALAAPGAIVVVGAIVLIREERIRLRSPSASGRRPIWSHSVGISIRIIAVTAVCFIAGHLLGNDLRVNLGIPGEPG
jgi:hypothetical protein